MIEIQTKVGGKSLTKVSGDDLKKVFGEAAFFQSLPPVCPRCKSEFRLAHRCFEGNHYYTLICDNGHQSNLGQHKDGGALFYKAADSWKTWQEIKDEKGGNGAQGNNGSQNRQEAPPDMPSGPPADDLPF